MNPWVLVGIVAAVLYGCWLLLDLIFQMIDHAHELRRESERRRGAVKHTSGEDRQNNVHSNSRHGSSHRTI